MEVTLVGPKGQTYTLGSGFSWTCLFFGQFGIPLYRRGLHTQAHAMLGTWLLYVLMHVIEVSAHPSWVTIFKTCRSGTCLVVTWADVLALMLCVALVYFGVTANKRGIATLLGRGWVISQDTPPQARVWARSLPATPNNSLQGRRP